jgi:tetratricopeptide (TPR) repeat protein
MLLYGVAILGNDRDRAATAIQGAMQHMYRLPERIQFQVKTSYYDFMQQPDKVIAVAKMRVELSPEDLEGRALLARLHKLRNERSEAIAQYEAILEIDPTQYEYLRELADQHRLSGDFEEAVSYYDRYAALFPENSSSFASLGGLYRILGQHERAKEYYDRALLLEPNDIATSVSLAQLERSFGNFEAEIEQLYGALQRSRTLEDSGVVLTALRRAHSFRGLASEAVEILETELAAAAQVSAAVPYLVSRLSTLGLYVQANRPEEAQRLYEEAAGELRPPFDKLASLGRLAIALERDDADAAELALVDLSAFIQAFGAGALMPQVHQARGRIHELRGEYDDAIESFAAQLESDHTRMSVLRDIGRCYREIGDLDKAEQYLNDARRVVPSDPRVLYELALTAIDAGNLQAAVEDLESAIDVWSDADPEYRYAREAREKLAELRDR